LVKNNKIGILIQARMSSNRLPGKSLINLTKELKVVDAVYLRCSQSKLNENIIFCISNNKTDDPLYEYLKDRKYKIIRGSENNLVQRFYDACKENALSSFIRVTGDNPLVDPEIINYFSLLESNLDFIDGYSPKKLPNGTIVSRMSLSLLRFLIKNEKRTEHLEHVVTSDLISKRFFPKFKKEWINPKVRYCIDYNEDYKFLKKLFEIDKILNLKTKDLISLYGKLDPENIKFAIREY